MPAREDAYARHQQARWMRPDAYRWIHLDAALLKPGSAPEDVFLGFERKYSPSQPRVPAGNPDGGQWTDGSGGGLRLGETIGERRRIANASPMGNIDVGDLGKIGNLGLFEIRPRERDTGDYTQLAGDPPTGGSPELPSSDPPEIPQEKPKPGGDLMKFIREGIDWVRKVDRYSPYADAFFGAIKQIDETNTIANAIKSASDPPRTLEELQNRVSSISESGYHDHHIAEKKAAEDAGFSDDLIHGRDNLVRIPIVKHIDITSYYARKVRQEDGTRVSPRDQMRSLDFEARRKFGLSVLRQFGVLK